MVHGDHRFEIMRLIGFLLRYGPKSMDEILAKTVRFNMEVADAIGEIMREEKEVWDRNLMTGDG